MLCVFLSEKNFPTLAALAADSAITITTLRLMKIPSKVLQFFGYGNFEDLLARVTVAKI